jgi:hypothetical protein
MPSPGPSPHAQTNAPIAAAIATAHARALPMRSESLTHSGIPAAPAMKYAARNSPCRASSRSTSAMKNSTSVAGIAEAMPLARNTTSRRRNSGSASGTRMPDHADPGACSTRGAAGARAMIAVQTRVIAAKPQTKRPRPVCGASGGPSSDGATLATTTPTSARPSRTAVIRVRSAGSAESSAPQALWLIVATLNAR